MVAWQKVGVERTCSHVQHVIDAVGVAEGYLRPGAIQLNSVHFNHVRVNVLRGAEVYELLSVLHASDHRSVDRLPPTHDVNLLDALLAGFGAQDHVVATHTKQRQVRVDVMVLRYSVQYDVALVLEDSHLGWLG